MTRPSSSEHWHGTEGGYTNHSCRCAECRAAWNKSCRDRKERRSAHIAADDPRHGKSTFYGNHKCRCAKCKAAWARDIRRRDRLRNLRKALRDDDLIRAERIIDRVLVVEE